MGNPVRNQQLFEKIRALPEEKVVEVEDFVDSLRQREGDRPTIDQKTLASGGAQRFMRLAGAVRGPEDLSSRKGFSLS